MKSSASASALASRRRHAKEWLRGEAAFAFFDKLVVPFTPLLYPVGHTYDPDGVQTFTYLIHRSVLALFRCIGVTFGELRAALRAEYPVTRCHHSYDCCGRWYCRGIESLVFTSEGLRVTISYHQNI